MLRREVRIIRGIEALRPFKRKLIWEAVLCSLAVSGVLVLPLWLALALLGRIAGIGLGLLEWMPAAYALAALALYGLRLKPSMMDVARRVDALGQMDRASTMVAYVRSDSVLSRLQREDAVRRLAAVPASSLRIRVPAVQIAVCLCLAGLILAVQAAPQHVFDALPFAQRQESEEVTALREKIMQLRGEVEAGELEAADKEKLLRQVDALLEQLDAGKMDIAALQEIRLMMEEMGKTIVELTPRDTYCAAMLEFESLAPLGEAIYKQNMDVVTLVLDGMAYQIGEKEGMDQMNALMDLVYDINASLSKPLRDNSQESLRQGMMMFSGGLESAAEMAFGGRDNAQMIETAFETAETFIREYLGVEGEQERYDPYEQLRREGKLTKGTRSAAMAAVPVEQTLSPAQTEHVYDPPESLASSSYIPGEIGTDGTVSRIMAPKDESLDGTVPYGEVYGAYYARYLEEAPEIPESLRQETEAYFDGL